MPRAIFKIRDPGTKLTRRMTFDELPSWHELSLLIGATYDILLNDVGISYVDFDGDNIVASTQDELEDMYLHATFPNHAIHVDVINLKAIRAVDHSLQVSTLPFLCIIAFNIMRRGGVSQHHPNLRHPRCQVFRHLATAPC